ncbi:MAG: AAA family ATPase [Arenicellales bacterium]
MTDLDTLLRQAVATRRPLLFLRSPEERRVIDAVKRVAGNLPVVEWTCTRGFESGFGKNVDYREPVTAVEAVVEGRKPGYYVFKDLSVFMDTPGVVRALRDAYEALIARPDTRLIILSPVGEVPEILRRDILLVDLPLPNIDQLAEEAGYTLRQYTSQDIPDDVLHNIALSLGGLGRDDARFVIHSALSGTEKLSRKELLEAVHDAKQALAGRAGFLQHVPVDRGIEHVGGLSNLKAWLDDRAGVFNRESMEAGVPIPRGMLITGVSGCGKSLCCKVLAASWDAPLYRLDMNLIFSDLHGNPEAAFHTALQTIESVAPAVLWIDEIENGLGFEEAPDPAQSHVFSAFLTWMQEKPPLVFVAATANRIEYLPPEMIRKGRFDQVFFVDLPNEEERKELISIHLKLNGADPADFRLDTLAGETQGWNGAEIEQAINSARIHAHRHKRALTTEDVVQQARQLVPLSRTMSEQIKKLRDWAWNRARPASGGAGTDYSILEEIKGNQP